MKTVFPSSLFAAVFSTAVLAWLVTQPTQAASVSYTLYMTEANKTITIPLDSKTYTRTFWVEGFANVSSGTPQIGGATLSANEGDTLSITVYNQTQESHDFEINGSGVAKTTIAAGTSKTLSFSALAAGDYIYYDPSNTNRAVGMYGALVIYPAGQSAGAAGNLWAGGPAYKKDYTWVLSDMDKLWNSAHSKRIAPPAAYKATYAFINGDFGSHSLKSLTNSPKVSMNDTIAIRIINPGMIAHPIHFHGYHGEVRAVNNVRQTVVQEKDVVDVGPMQSVDLIFHINQPGMYIIHDHTGMMVTQDGIYAEGMIAEFDACSKMTPAELQPFTINPPFSSACDKYCPKPNIGVPWC